MKATDRPLFVPLKRQYFEAFRDGSKTTEYRLYGRGWNERTCYAGRPVVLSLGYSGPRLRARVDRFERLRMTTEIYGPDRVIAAIHLTDIQPIRSKS